MAWPTVINLAAHYSMYRDTRTAFLVNNVRSDLQNCCSLQHADQKPFQSSMLSQIVHSIVRRSPNITVKTVWHDPQHHLPAACKLDMHGMHWWYLVRLSIRLHIGTQRCCHVLVLPHVRLPKFRKQGCWQHTYDQ
jgi:hypothetical protein